MKDKKPDNYTEKQWTDFKEIRDSFIDVLKDEDLVKINNALNHNPENEWQGKEDDLNNGGKMFHWDNCPLKMTASYYANNKVFGETMPIYDPVELKALINE